MFARAIVVALLLALVGCNGATGPAADHPTTDEQFLATVEGMTTLTDEEALTMAKDMCFEMDLHVKNQKDFRLFLRTWVVRVQEKVESAQVMPFIVAAMKAYCPEVERFRPKVDV